jgi:hypothetical protein
MEYPFPCRLLVRIQHENYRPFGALLIVGCVPGEMAKVTSLGSLCIDAHEIWPGAILTIQLHNVSNTSALDHYFVSFRGFPRYLKPSWAISTDRLLSMRSLAK